MSGLERVVLGLLAVATLPAWWAMVQVWTRVDYLSHGFLVPAVALWASQRDRAERASLPVAGDPLGGFGLALGLLLEAAGLALGSVTLKGLGVVALLAGAVWWLRGRAWLRALAFPLGFLLFMVPPPAAWLAPIVQRLQLLVSSAALRVLHAFDLAVAREGNVIVLPGDQTLFVAEACSGVTSIVTLVPLAVFLGYFTERRIGRRLLLVAAVMPAAFLGNLLRVVGTVIAAMQVGVPAATDGIAHELAGFLTFTLACGILIALSLAMRQRTSAQTAGA